MKSAWWIDENEWAIEHTQPNSSNLQCQSEDLRSFWWPGR